jgi:hypothetical protein
MHHYCPTKDGYAVEKKLVSFLATIP